MEKKLTMSNGRKVDVFYVESLNRLLKEGRLDCWLQEENILFMSQPSLYEQYYDRFLKRLKNKEGFHWFIAPVNPINETLSSFLRVLAFIEEMKLPKKLIVIGIGDEMIYHLGAILRETSPYVRQFIYVPSSFAGFSLAINQTAFLYGQRLDNAIEQKALPDGLIYDTMMVDTSKRSISSLSFLRLFQFGLQQNKEVLQRLFVGNDQYSSYAEEVFQLAEAKVSIDYQYGICFSRALLQTEGNHHLDFEQKIWLGVLLQLAWSVERMKFKLDLNRIKRWLEQTLSKALYLPAQLLRSELSERIMAECLREGELTVLSGLGQSLKTTIPTRVEVEKIIKIF
ncbi:hypothetical protein [Vagococcus sp.]|uniref:hypothetical protein n=1 Tax=Vagococcus sp. TaxID=1933889 RepID=UPI003F973659